MKILVYGNRKSDDVYYQIDTLEQGLAAYLKIFKQLDSYCQCYTDADKYDKPLVEKARIGDGVAAKKLMKRRKNYEYEYVHEEEVNDPLEVEPEVEPK